MEGKLLENQKKYFLHAESAELAKPTRRKYFVAMRFIKFCEFCGWKIHVIFRQNEFI